MTKTRMVTAALLGLALAAPRVDAQQNDPRWTPWVGCWEPVAEESAGDLLCVRPAGAAVEVTEIVEGTVRSTQTLAADGRAYAIRAEGCEGTRTAEFSADGKRIFTITEQACDGDIPRTTTGLIAMVTPTEWIDIQAAQEDGQALGWARRYRPASTTAAAGAGFGDLGTEREGARRARASAAQPVDVDDMIEAVRAVDPEGVRTWIAELREPFDLDADRLVRLADAGVSESVIDVMVAVSYPDRFSVDREGDVERLAARNVGAPRRGFLDGRRRGFFGPVYWDPFMYDSYGYGRGYGYGYGYGGGYYGPGVVIVEPRRDEEPNARVVRGRGYSRGTGGSRNDPPAARQPSSGGSSSPPASEPSSDSGSGSGSGSSSGGRTAKPRGG
jgi:hypothetical protein